MVRRVFDLFRIVHMFYIKEKNINRFENITESNILYYNNKYIMLNQNYNFISTYYIIHDLESILFNKGDIPWLNNKITKSIDRYILFNILKLSQNQDIINFYEINKYIIEKFIELFNHYKSKKKNILKYHYTFITQAYNIIEKYFPDQL